MGSSPRRGVEGASWQRELQTKLVMPPSPSACIAGTKAGHNFGGKCNLSQCSLQARLMLIASVFIEYLHMQVWPEVVRVLNLLNDMTLSVSEQQNHSGSACKLMSFECCADQ